jgi:hypothetical protein
MGQPTKEGIVGKSRLSPGQKAELVILGIGNPGEVSKLCRQYGVHPISVLSVEEAIPGGWQKVAQLQCSYRGEGTGQGIEAAA